MAIRKQPLPTAGGLSGVKRTQMQTKPLLTGQRTGQVKLSTGLPAKKSTVGAPPQRRGAVEGPRRRKIGIDRVR